MGRKLLALARGTMLALVLLLVLLPGVASGEGDRNTASTDWVTGTTTYTYTSLDSSAGCYSITADDDVVLDFTGVDTSQDITRTITLKLNSPGLTVTVKGPADNEVGVSLTIEQINSASSTTEEAGSTVFLKDFRADKLTLETPESTPPLTVKYDGNCYIGSLFVTACTDCSIKNADASAQLEIGTMWSKISSSSATGDAFNSDNKLTLSGVLVFNGGISSPNLVIQDANVTFSNKGGVVAKHLAIKNSTINGVGQIATISGAFAQSDTEEGVEKFKGSTIEITGSNLYFDSKVFEGNVNSTVLGNSETINITNSKIYNVVSTGSLGCVGGLFETLVIAGSEVHAQSDSAAAIGPHDSAYDYYDDCDITAPSTTIDGSVIEAVSKKGAAIGMPRFSSEPTDGVPTLSITISGNSDITATSVQSAAIGGAYYGNKSQVADGIEAEISAGISGGSGFSLLSLWDGLVSLFSEENTVQDNIVSSEQLMDNCTLTIEGTPAINAKSGALAVYASSVTASDTNLVQNTLVTTGSDGFGVYPMETPGEVTIGSASLGSIGYGYASVATTKVAVQSGTAMRFGDAPLVDATNEQKTTFSVSGTCFQQFFTTPQLSLSGTVKLVDNSDGAEVTGSAAVGTTLKVDLSELLPSAAFKSNSLSYAWYRDGTQINGASTSTYELTTDDSGKVVYCVVSGTGSFTGSVTSNAVTVSSSATLDAPTLSERTKNSITLESNATQYGIVRNGQTEWQVSSTFSGLIPFTAYTFVQKNSSDSISGAVAIYTLPDENDLVIDYVNETLSFPSGVNLYSDAECSTSTWLNQHSSTTRIKISDFIASAGGEGKTLYACYSKADYAAPITIPARPSASVPEPTNVTSNVISFTGDAGVTYRLLAGGNVVETKTPDSDGNVSFDGLSPATDYSLRARKEASNEGDGNFASVWSEPTPVTTSAAAPDAPALSVKAEYVDEGYESVRVGLSWTTPADNGSTITGYTLTVTEQGSATVVDTQTIASDITSNELTTGATTGLQPGKTYNFVLSVNWPGGEAVPSNTASCTLPNLKPDPSKFTINYVDETISVPENVCLYVDQTCKRKLSSNDSEGSIYALTDCIGTTIYARFNGVTDATAVTDYIVPSRPSGPSFEIDSAFTTYDTIQIRIWTANVGSVFKLYQGDTFVHSYTKAQGDSEFQKFTNLTSETAYTIKAQAPAVDGEKFASLESSKDVTTASLTDVDAGTILVLANQISSISINYSLQSVLDGATISSVTYDEGNAFTRASGSSKGNTWISISMKVSADEGAEQGISVIAKNTDGTYSRFKFTALAVDVYSRLSDDSVFWVESEVTEDEKGPVSAVCADELEELGAGAEIVDVVRLTPRNPVGGEILTDNSESATYTNKMSGTYSATDKWAVYWVNDASSEASEVESSFGSGNISFTTTDTGGYYAIAHKPVVSSFVSVELLDSTYGEDTFKEGELISVKVTVTPNATPENYPAATGIVKVYEGIGSNGTLLVESQLENDGTVTIDVKDESGTSLQVGNHSLYIEYVGDTNFQASSCDATLKIIAPPGKPTLSAISETNAVVLEWDTPNDNGSSITGYTLKYSANGEEENSISIDTETTSYTVTGLVGGQEYEFVLTAINAAGSTDSESVSVTPNKPVKYQITCSSDLTGGSIFVDKNSAVEGETVTVTVEPGESYELRSVTYSHGDEAQEIEPDDNGAYAFQMPAAPVTVTAEFKPVAPGAPENLEAKPGKRAVTLTWETPSGGVAVDHYELAVTGDGSSEPVATIGNIASSARAHTVDSLEAGVSYTFALTAVTAAGGRTPASVRATVLAEYAVSVDGSITGGTVAASPDSAVEGETVTVTVKPGEGYEVASVSYTAEGGSSTGITPGEGGKYTFQMPAADVTVTATFKLVDSEDPEPTPGGDGGAAGENPDPVTYGVTITCGDGGDASSDVATAAQGDSVTVVVTPDEGFVVDGVTVSSGTASVDVSDDNGTYVFTMPGGSVVVTVTFSPVSSSLPELPFTDVDPNVWYFEAVSFVYQNGLMTGYDNTTLFGPGDQLNREQAAVILWRALGNGEQAPASSFGDVDQGSWYANAVNWVCEQGLLTGYEDGSHTFGVGDALTREQFAVILARVTGADLSDVDLTVLERFSDTADVADWSHAALAWAVQNKVLNGSETQDGSLVLRASSDINRAEMAQMIMNVSKAGLLPLG